MTTRRGALLVIGLLLPALFGAASASASNSHRKALRSRTTTTVATSGSAPPIEAKRDQLEGLRSRIEKLHQDLLKTEESHSSVSDQLKETESAISDANRGLHELGERRNEMQKELSGLQHQSQDLEKQISAQQKQLGDLLYRQYINGNRNALHLLLGGNDPNQAARDLYYMSQLSSAKADLIGTLRDTLTEKERLAGAARNKRDEIATIEKSQQQQRVILINQQRQRQAVLTKLSDRLKAQRREIDTLRRDEIRLGKLIEGLARIVARPAKIKQPTKPRQESPGTPETPLRNEQMPESDGFTGNFAALKGRLRLPVRGDIAHRFGTPRAEGGATWKGLFIRAAEGADIRAIAPGRVVFADWLRGFGNLLIVDHGDTYLSVYGNNQSLLRQTGDTVNSGDIIAAAGNSGGNPESGLYFELRRQGQAIDPLKWTSLK